jgi:hypothetical protein
VQDGAPSDEHELRLALLCLFYDGNLATNADFEEASELKLRLRARESFERRFRMLRAEPGKYLGPRWTPGTEGNRQGRELSLKIAERAGVLPPREGGSNNKKGEG